MKFNKFSFIALVVLIISLAAFSVAAPTNTDVGYSANPLNRRCFITGCDWHGETYLMCDPGNLPHQWREKVSSFLCYPPHGRKRSVINTIDIPAEELVERNFNAAVPPIPYPKQHSSAHVNRDIASASNAFPHHKLSDGSTSTQTSQHETVIVDIPSPTQTT
jgi:hypothetical protein